MKVGPHKDLYLNIFSTFVYNIHKLEITQITSTWEWICNVEHLHTVEYYSATKMKNDWYKDLDQSQRPDAQRKKQNIKVIKGYILYD